MSMIKHSIIVIALMLLVIGFASAFALRGISLVQPPNDLRSLAFIYVITTFNEQYKTISAMVPEAVTAIVWDYRGLDTLFETSVMFLAIVGALMLTRGFDEKQLPKTGTGRGLSLIVKTITKIVVVMIFAVATSLSLHGHLTPGGGFQGGATAAVAPVLLIVTFSIYVFIRMMNIKRAVAFRTIGLISIGIASFIVLLIALISGGYGYIFQNQIRTGAPFYIPSYIGGGIVLGGTLLIFNASETFAVAFGFMALFILMTISEEYIKDVVVKGEE